MACPVGATHLACCTSWPGVVEHKAPLLGGEYAHRMLVLSLPMYACAVVERLGEARGQGKDRWWSRASMCTMACAVRCSRGKPSAVLACVCSVCVPSCRASAATLPLAYLAIFALIGALFESPHGSANEPQCPTHHQCLSELVCSPAGPLLYMLVVVLSP